MPVVCLDSSAIVKMLAEEVGSELAAQSRDGATPWWPVGWPTPEVRAALAARRNHDLDPGGQATAEQTREQS